jgi:large subunit ribosomal protein L6
MASRVGRTPIALPKNVEVKFAGESVSVKGPKGTLQHKVPAGISVKHEEDHLAFAAADESIALNALAGTTRAILNNMVHGVVNGYEIKLVLVGVGYRAQVQGNALNLTLGFSHPVKFTIPTGVTIEVPSQTEVVVKSIDKHLVGQVAANIRRFRAPERYKGKGIRYATEVIVLKETKKK